MREVPQRIFQFTIVFLAILLLAACQPAIPMDLAPEEIIQSASQRLQQTSGFSFLFDSEGYPAYLDSGHNYAFGQLQGEFTVPDRLQAKMRIITPGLVSEVKIICIGDQQWETNFVTGKWELLPEDLSFNPIQFFNPQTGIPSITADLSDLQLVGLEELDTLPGVKLYAITATLEGQHVSDLSYGMISNGTLTAKLWIAPKTYELYRIQMVENSDNPDLEKTWLIDFWNYDTDTSIQPPAEGAS
jgi:hypothetical protein